MECRHFAYEEDLLEYIALQKKEDWCYFRKNHAKFEFIAIHYFFSINRERTLSYSAYEVKKEKYHRISRNLFKGSVVSLMVAAYYPYFRDVPLFRLVDGSFFLGITVGLIFFGIMSRKHGNKEDKN